MGTAANRGNNSQLQRYIRITWGALATADNPSGSDQLACGGGWNISMILEVPQMFLIWSQRGEPLSQNFSMVVTLSFKHQSTMGFWMESPFLTGSQEMCQRIVSYVLLRVEGLTRDSLRVRASTSQLNFLHIMSPFSGRSKVPKRNQDRSVDKRTWLIRRQKGWHVRWAHRVPPDTADPRPSFLHH